MVRVLPSLRTQVGPPPVRPKGDLARLLGLVLPVVILEAFIAVVDAGCTDIAGQYRALPGFAGEMYDCPCARRDISVK